MTDLLTRADVTASSHVDAPTSSLRGTVAESLALAVAPSTGRFQPVRTVAVQAGETLGFITGGKGRADEVVAPVAGAVARLLVRPGQLVTRGQGLVWLERDPDGGEA